MAQHEARAVEVALATLSSRVEADARLAAERQRAHREFFGEVGGGAAAELRFLEWFLLERESETLGAAPVDLPQFESAARDLGGSVAGVFLVVAEGDAVEAQDLQDDTGFDLSVPPRSLRTGDMLVGRLFPSRGGAWSPSTSVAVFRPGEQLAQAFRRDLGRLGLDRRLRQIELEHLLLRRPDQAPSPTATPVDDTPLEHLEADLERQLVAGGSALAAAAVSGQLAAADRPGAVLGPLLDELAFDTAVDLDKVRELLLRIWNAHHAGAQQQPEPAAAGGAETLGERLARTLDEGLRQKRDVEDLFAQLERMAGIDGDEAGDDETGVEPGGDLDPLVQEYLWETGRDAEAGAAALRLWVVLQGNAAVPRTDLEQVTSSDLLRVLVHCYLRAAPGQRASAVRTAFGELQRFYEWAAATQDLELTAVLQQCRAPFVDDVERFADAGVALSSETAPSARPALLAVEDVAADGFGVRLDEGDHHWLRAAPATAALLRVGDLVLGALDTGARGPALRGMIVVLPGEARHLME